MPLVLAIEPDHRQATTLKRVVREIVKADLVLVESRDAAISALDAQIPDVILVTALLSPRDEEELVTHLRALDGAEHLQTHTIPQLTGSRGDIEAKSGGGGLLGKFRKKKEAEPTFGCDPELFAEEIRTFLARAAHMKAEAVATLQHRVAQLEAQVDAPSAQKPSRRSKGKDAARVDPAPFEAPATGDGSAWDSPFEWRRSEPPAALARTDGQPATSQSVPPSLITNVPLAVLAAEDESRAAEEQRDAERRRMDEERARLEAAAAAERERAERLRQEAEQQRVETDRLRAAADVQSAAAVARAREEERKKAEASARIVAERAREDERKRLEAEAKAATQRAREEERKKAEAETRAAAERVREEERRKAEAAAKAAAEEARRRVEAEARAAADRVREEERKKAEAAAQRAREEERKKAEAEAKAAAERAREDERRKLEAKLAAERAKEAERRRLEAEAAAAREREAERLRKEAEAVAEKKRQEERRRLEAEAAKAAERAREEERRRLEAERRRIEAEALVERERAERRRVEEEAAAERERAAAAERERMAAAEAERRAIAVRERAAQRKRNKRANRGAAGENGTTAPLVVSDQFAEFREEYDHVGPGVFRLMPLAAWARTEHQGSGTTDMEPAAPDDLRELMAGWTLPTHVAGVTYARGCRIRRVRVPAATGLKKERGARPLIVSRRALDEARSNNSR